MDIEESYKQAIINIIAEKDIEQIRELVTANINLLKEIDVHNRKIKDAERVYDEKANLMSRPRGGDIDFEHRLKAYKDKIEQMKLIVTDKKIQVNQNKAEINNIIHTRLERIKQYLEG